MKNLILIISFAVVSFINTSYANVSFEEQAELKQAIEKIVKVHNSNDQVVISFKYIEKKSTSVTLSFSRYSLLISLISIALQILIFKLN